MISDGGILVDLGLRKARVWFDDHPGCSYQPTQIIESATIVEELTIVPSRQVCVVEMLVPKGARVVYGLLGVEYVPARSQKLFLQVGITTDDGPSFHNALASPFGGALIGLPSEYADSVLRGALAGIDEHPIGGGTLRFNWAAHSLVYSSPRAFEHLAKAITCLLSCRDNQSFERIVGCLDLASL